MKLATNIKNIQQFGFQLIIEDSMVLGINLLYEKKILKKCRFKNPKHIENLQEEALLVKDELFEIFNL